MLKPDLSEWNQTVNDLLNFAIRAEHPRSREWFLALYPSAREGGKATAYVSRTQRDRIIVIEWVRQYNALGAQALYYWRSGGNGPLLRKTASAKASSYHLDFPVQQALPGQRWTSRKVLMLAFSGRVLWPRATLISSRGSILRR